MSTETHWHQQVPRDYVGNLKYRARMLRLASGVLERRALIEMCRRDILFYINTFVWQTNSKAGPGREVGPFVTYPYQDRAILAVCEAVEKGFDLTFEKSRQMGASWMMLIIADWYAHFHKWKTFLFISRDEKSVEDESPNSLFWKVEYIHSMLPDWLKPRLKRRKMYFGYEQTESAIFGEASTAKANVGGNTTAMFIDEFAQIRDAYAVLHRTSESTNCRIFNSTHLGEDTAFYELTRRPDMRKVVMHWTEHPEYSKGLYRYNAQVNKVEVLDRGYEYAQDFKFVMDSAPVGGPYPSLRSPWYDRQCLRKGRPQAVAQDLDIDPQGSVSQAFNPLIISNLIREYAMPPLWEGDIIYDMETGKPLELRKEKGGKLKLWCQPDMYGDPPKADYAVGTDLSRGVGTTASVVSMGNADTGEKVLEYSDPWIDPKDLAVMVVALCRMFKNKDGDGAFLGWEKIGPGESFGDRIVDLGWRRIYMYSPSERTKTGRNSKAALIPGWAPTTKAKDKLLNEYRYALENRLIVNHSEAALRETMLFTYAPDGSFIHGKEKNYAAAAMDPSHAKLNHADIVMADALMYKMMCEIGFAVYEDKDKEPDEIPVNSIAWRRKYRDNLKQEAWA